MLGAGSHKEEKKAYIRVTSFFMPKNSRRCQYNQQRDPAYQNLLAASLLHSVCFSITMFKSKCKLKSAFAHPGARRITLCQRLV
jgi:hypothetical protein